MASKLLGEALDVSRVGYGTIDPVAETLRVVRDWNAPGVQSLAGTLRLRDDGSLIDDLHEGKFILSITSMKISGWRIRRLR
jgi:hypothetical protein